jgi:hypothetical protein
MEDFNSGRQIGVRSSDTSGAPVWMSVRQSANADVVFASPPNVSSWPLADIAEYK